MRARQPASAFRARAKIYSPARAKDARRGALDALARHGVTWTTIPYATMHKNGGGIHCSTTPLRRDKV
jgi:hypothetical protein